MKRLVTFVLDIKTVSEANKHEHWRARQRRAKGQRFAAASRLMLSLGNMNPLCRGSYFGHHPEGRVEVSIKRIAPRELDGDNLQTSQKHVRDGLADALGVNDRDKRITWVYGQGKGAPKAYGVLVNVLFEHPDP